jgi:NAD+ diphosphatase
MIFVPALQPLAHGTPMAWCFAFVDGKLLLPESSTLQPQPLQGFEALTHSRHYLGRLDDLDCWALQLREAPAGWQGTALRAAMLQFPDALMGLASRAAQVLEWDRAHRFCGVCGTPTEPAANERSRKCPACGHSAYPRLSPAMMVLIYRGRELLLARSPHYAPGMFSALAGFVEAGESLEDCVHREVLEEVGVTVRHLRYYGSQSWPFPHSLMLAFSAEWQAGEVVPQEDEIEAAGWFDIDALPGIPPRFSIAGHLIRDTVEALRDGRSP